MRSQIDNSLIGTILSLPFPIKCEIPFCKMEEEEYTKAEIIIHGCTTFLNVYSKLRHLGMCMFLIKELISYGYEKNIYCSYQMTSFKLCENSFQISAFYRPLNLLRAANLGFVFSGFDEIHKFNQNRMKYNNKTPKGYSIKQVSIKNSEKALSFYNKMTNEKKFVFSPDLQFFNKWITEFPTFIVFLEKKIVGIFSIKTIDFGTLNEIEGELCLPLLFSSKKEEKEKVLKCLISTASERNFDVLYLYSVGDLTQEILESVHAIKTNNSWFSLYNNSMKLTPLDLYVPLF